MSLSLLAYSDRSSAAEEEGDGERRMYRERISRTRETSKGLREATRALEGLLGDDLDALDLAFSAATGQKKKARS